MQCHVDLSLLRFPWFASYAKRVSDFSSLLKIVNSCISTYKMYIHVSYIIQLLTGRPRATFCLQVKHIICCPNPQSIIVLLCLHWLRINYSIQTIHKHTDHDQTGLNLDELIWDELALVWINSYTITPVHVIQVANNKFTQLGTNWLRTKWIQNESTCLWRQTRHSGPTYVFICPRSNIDFYMHAASNIKYRDYIEKLIRV